jgi:hydrogenase large subunit
VCIDDYLSFSKAEDLDKIGKDLKDFIDLCFEHGFDKIGKSYNRHLVLSSTELFKVGKSNKRVINRVDLERIEESCEYTFNIDKTKQSKEAYTWAKNVRYADNFFETGPLSRAVISKRAFISKLHEKFEDSVLTRVMARMDEFVHLLYITKNLISKIDISEESFVKPKISLNEIKNAEAKSVVEASRGSLFHDISIKDGKISKYNVITPTVWNLGPGNKNEPSVAQKAIIGLDSIEKAEITLRSFDICSVCTTH